MDDEDVGGVDDPGATTDDPGAAPDDPGAEVSGLYATLPFASGAGPRRRRVTYPLPLIGIALLLSFALVGFATLGTGGGPRSAASSGDGSPAGIVATTTTTNHAVAPQPGSAPAQPTKPASNAVSPARLLAAIGVSPGDLGNLWVDLGVSANGVATPSVCRPYEGIFTGATTASVHQYLFSAQSGSGAGDLSSTVADTGSPGTAASSMSQVRGGDFATCAEAMAEQLLGKFANQPVIQSATARRTSLSAASGVVGWRALVTFAGPGGPGVFGLDVFYVSSGSRLAQVQMSRCACPTPSIATGTPLLPDEILAVSAVADRISEPPAALAQLPDASSPGGSSTGPCALLSYGEVSSLLPAQTPGSEGTLSDGANECTWPEGGAVLSLETGDTTAQFEARLRDAPEVVHGLGDQAASGPGLSGKLLVRKGQIWVEVVVDGTIVNRINAVTVTKALLAEL